MKMNFDEFENQRMIENPENYKAGIFYFNRKDTRVIIPKRDHMRGWTLNFGRVYTYLLILAFVLFIILITKLG